MNPLAIQYSQTRAWAAVREQMENRFDGMCELCEETPLKLHIHHKNGCALDNRWENLMAVCPKCHRKIHKHNLNLEKAYYDEGQETQ